ncbi:MAG: AMP-binding protein [Chitinivibrionales bacterium]|nr:AMP-binding protein [Chitinivibrionales bacterium]MBD3394447.1 AMP-binding protein [Chitinivibrionales bacterium]
MCGSSSTPTGVTSHSRSTSFRFSLSEGLSLDFNPELSWEFWPEEKLAARTLRALQNHVEHVRKASPYYAEALAEIDGADIRSLDDFAKLPFTDKSTLVDAADRFMAVPPERITETVVTSGSSGRPLVFSMTAGDLDRLAFNEALSFHGAGVKPGDRAQILVSLDRLFIAGMAYYRGLTLLGANTARIGVLPFDMQKHYVELLEPDVVVCVPSFMKRLGKELQTRGFDTRASSIRKIVCIGESIRRQDMSLNAVGSALEDMFDARVYSTYGNTELAVAYCECEAQSGNHAHPELVYTEVVGDDGRPVPDGEPGELVATPLGVEGMPLVRYKTGDITFKICGTCACGRTSCRIGPILARKSQMIKFKGTTLYPLTILNALDELDCIDDFLVVLEGDASLADTVTIHAVTPPASLQAIADHLRARARVQFPVLVTNAPTINSLRGDSRKKVKIIDKRAKTRAGR